MRSKTGGLEDWCIENKFDIAQSMGGEPTFMDAQGVSWIDVIITKDVTVGKLRVLQKETFCDHEYLEWEIDINTGKEMEKRYWNMARANWLQFRREIKKWVVNEELSLTEKVTDAKIYKESL